MAKFFNSNKSIPYKPSSSLQTSSSNQTVLLARGAGYTGSSLLNYLIDSGYKVRLLDLLLYKVVP